MSELLVMLVVVMLVMNWISASGHRRSQQHQLDKLHTKIDLVMAQMGDGLAEAKATVDRRATTLT
ncbi:hypothetical protein [Promicromonospora iranensis]|uniref:Membrane protein affecting hemolysin expression n=1 Tax=Promicromonospora iranensis TaxID=1105144 RepID=A0ABU2CN96_9MICO|nr:hypothetical protein [Promicromonospora iranensis]MDR7382798.1 putative membrane protein affecting hemolysin expression [Promicromonospora iranensis]